VRKMCPNKNAGVEPIIQVRHNTSNRAPEAQNRVLGLYALRKDSPVKPPRLGRRKS
jgi:hypothetical protein